MDERHFKLFFINLKVKFMENPKKRILVTLTTDKIHEILNQVWGADVIVGDRTIDVHIRKIRQKLDIDCITTVKGVGYKFEMGTT